MIMMCFKLNRRDISGYLILMPISHSFSTCMFFKNFDGLSGNYGCDRRMKPVININVWNTPFLAHNFGPIDNREKRFV